MRNRVSVRSCYRREIAYIGVSRESTVEKGVKSLWAVAMRNCLLWQGTVRERGGKGTFAFGNVEAAVEQRQWRRDCGQTSPINPFTNPNRVCGHCGTHGSISVHNCTTQCHRPVKLNYHGHNIRKEGSCKIWAFHSGDYEECRLLVYKNPVRTSQKAHYVSATEPSRLMLCKIRGSHGGDYDACLLLGCDTVWLLEPTFQRNVSPPSSGWKDSAS
jgi:hypothetical protein